MTIKHFLIQLGFMLLFIFVIFGAVMLWLKFYTNHGQKLELPDYRNMHIEEAGEDASDRSFEIIVKDSTYKVGMEGGIILAQNPRPGAMVKEERKIYVDISKYNPDVIMLSDLRPMYGHEYDNKKRELAALQINSEIKDRRYDPGEPNHILEVWYEGEKIDGHTGRTPGVEIEVGSTLEFVISGVEGGSTDLRDYRCKTIRVVRFMIDQSKLNVGEITRTGVITDLENAYVIAQYPPFEDGATIPLGNRIDLTVQQDKPPGCN